MQQKETNFDLKILTKDCDFEITECLVSMVCESMCVCVCVSVCLSYCCEPPLRQLSD